MIAKPLGDSKELARLKAARWVAAYEEVFARLRAKEEMSPDQIEAAVSLDVEAVARQYKAKVLSDLPISLDYWLNLKPPKEHPGQLPLLDTYSGEVEATAKMFDLDPRNPTTYNMIREVVVRVLQEAEQERQAGYQEAAQERLTQLAQEMANLDDLPKHGYQEKVQERRAQIAQEMVKLHAVTKLTGDKPPPMMTAAPAPVEAVPTESLRQALEGWLANPCLGGKPQRWQTTEGHRTHVNRFIKWIERERHVASGEGGNIALSSIIRAEASDYIASLKGQMVTRTKNNHRMSLKMLFDNAGLRGRLPDGYRNPFDGLHQRLTDEESESSFSIFEPSEIKAILDSSSFETSPKHHTNQTALSWACLIATFSGMCLEEIAQLNAADIHDESANGSTVTVIDIHNGGKNHLKNNKGRVRKVPIHSELVRVGLLRYRDALPQGSLLFPGLTRRASKGGKIGGRTSELFGKKLKRLGIKQKAAEDGRKLGFHSYRHTVVTMLERAGLHETVIGAIVGHAGKTITSRVYGKEAYKGAGLKVLAGYVEQISYPDLRLPTAV